MLIGSGTGVGTEEEERPVRRSSKVTLGSPMRQPVALKDSTDDDDDDLQSLRSSRLRMACWESSSASLPEGDLQSMSAKTKMARNLSNASLRVQETEDDYTDEEDDYALAPPRKSPKVKRKPQTSSGTLPLPHTLDDLTAQFQGFMPMGPDSPHWSRVQDCRCTCRACTLIPTFQRIGVLSYLPQDPMDMSLVCQGRLSVQV